MRTLVLFAAFFAGSAARAAESCADKLDNDGDGAADCADLDCGLAAECCGAAASDVDGDGWCDPLDRCVLVPDPAQADADQDGAGDLCDVCPVPGDGVALFGPAEPYVHGLSGGAGLPIATGDIDGDGDLDVVIGDEVNLEVQWFANDGAGGFTGQVISAVASTPTSIDLSDVDGDGDLDVLMANYDDLLFENLGAGAAWGTTVLANSAWPAGGGAMHTSDLDGDGDLDVLDAAQASWEENLGAGVFASPVALLPGAVGGTDAFPADIDGDGLDDVLWCHTTAVDWYPNLGGPTLGAASPISGERCGSVSAADLDGDGDPDALVAAPYQGQVAWYPNLGGTFGAKQLISSAAPLARRALARDLDGDGDLDVVVGGEDTATKAWYENLGGGAFGPGEAISDRWGGEDLAVADVDGDGDDDALVPDKGAFEWFPNLAECALVDTDCDGWRDSEELQLYGTDPLVPDADADQDGIGDGCDLFLVAGPAVVGQPLHVEVRGALSSDKIVVWLAKGPPGPGGCPPELGGQCLDLVNPHAVAQGRADASGFLALDAPLPAGAPVGASIAVQAGVLRGPGSDTTQAVALVVGP